MPVPRGKVTRWRPVVPLARPTASSLTVRLVDDARSEEVEPNRVRRTIDRERCVVATRQPLRKRCNGHARSPWLWMEETGGVRDGIVACECGYARMSVKNGLPIKP